MTPDIALCFVPCSLAKMQIFIFTEHCNFNLRKNSNDNVELGIDKEVMKYVFYTRLKEYLCQQPVTS